MSTDQSEETNKMTANDQATPSSNKQPTRGWINCYYRTYKGKRPGPYYVRRLKVGKKLFKEYVKADQVEKIRAECQAHREGRKRISRFLNNVEFLGNCLNRYDSGEVVTLAMEDTSAASGTKGHITRRQTANAP